MQNKILIISSIVVFFMLPGQLIVKLQAQTVEEPVGRPAGPIKCYDQNGEKVTCPNDGSSIDNSSGISAQQIRENMLALRRKKAHGYNDTGNELYKQGKYGSAVKYYQKARKYWPEDVTILDNLKKAISLIPDDAIDRNKVTDKSWRKSRGLFKFHEWADIWADKEKQNIADRSTESSKLGNQASQLSDQRNFKEAYQKLNDALEIDPDNSAIIHVDIKRIKNVEVLSLNNEMLVLSNSDYEAALLKAREASLVDPDNKLTKENLNKIEVQTLINEANNAKAMEANDLALYKLKKALEKDAGNPEIQNNINNIEDKIEKDLEFEKNRIKYTKPVTVSLDESGIKDLTGIAANPTSERAFDEVVKGGAIYGDKTIENPRSLEAFPAYKKVINEMKIIQKGYVKMDSELEIIHVKMKDPETKPEELAKLVDLAKAKKNDIEGVKKTFEEKKQVKEEIVKSFHITSIDGEKNQEPGKE